MDRSFLSQPQVVAASRALVCIRLATYEDEHEAVFLKAFTRTGSGELENTVFGILAPDGKEKLIRPSRGPEHLFAGPGALAEAMTKAAAKFPGKPADQPAPLTLVANVKLGINMAAADNQPLVIVVGNDAAERSALARRLAALAWDKEFVGRFVFAAGPAAELVAIEGAPRRTGLLAVEPEKFGRTGRLLTSLALAGSDAEIAGFLREVGTKFKRTEKSFKIHVRQGHQEGVFWETQIPVTDPMELRARERGKRK